MELKAVNLAGKESSERPVFIPSIECHVCGLHDMDNISSFHNKGEGSMLVLTRKVDEKIIIGGEKPIIAKILRVRNGKVRIGIDAPKEVKIFREEIQQGANDSDVHLQAAIQD